MISTIYKDNHYISINNNNNNNNTNVINCNTIPTYIKTLNDIINKYSITKYTHYYIIHNSKIINKNTTLSNFLLNHTNANSNTNSNIFYIDIFERLNGGSFSDVLDFIIKIGKFFSMIYGFLKWVGAFLYWLLYVVKWFFTDFLNPKNIVLEFGNTLKMLLISICRLPFDIILGLMALSVNVVGGWMQGFWGWDQSSLTQDDKNSNYFKKMNKNRTSKCYLTNTNTIPFSVILGTLLCPPIGVFMDVGLTGWVYILICILLTLLFYFPGLIYALLVIYS